MTDKPLDNQSDPLEGLPKLTPKEELNNHLLEGLPSLKPKAQPTSDLDGLPTLTPREKALPQAPVREQEDDLYSAKLRSEDVLLENGFDPKIIGRSLNPNPVTPDSTEVRRTYGVGAPESTTPEARAAMALDGQMAADGTPLPRGSWEKIQSLMMKSQYEGVEGLAASRGWWMRSKRTIARGVAPLVPLLAADFGMGLGLLDTFAWGAKKLKVGMSPAAQRAEVEALLLPKVRIGEDEYTSGATAALSFHRDRWWGGLQVGAGAALGTLATIMPTEGRTDLLELARGMRKSGGRTWLEATRDAARIPTALGGYEGWHQIVDRHYQESAEGRDVNENFYAWMEQSGWKGEMVMGAIALADVPAELVMDPFFAAGAVLQKVAPAVQAFTAATRPAKHLDIVHDVARSTQRFEDAVDALRAAENNLAKVEGRVLGRAVTRDGYAPKFEGGEEVLGRVPGAQISREGAEELVQARRMVANEKQFLSEFADEGPSSPVNFKRAKKRSPDFKPETKETYEYLENFPAVNKDGVFYTGWVKRREVRPRRVDEIAEEMTLRRHAEIERDADQVIFWDDLPTDNKMTQQRALFGPDDTEQAGDGINHMVRTGGQGIDDVTMTPNAPEFTVIPEQGQVPIRDWRAIDAANDATKAEKAYLGTLQPDGYRTGGTASGQYSLEMSTKRSLSRQLDIANRNLGHARRNKDKAKIKLFEDEAAKIKAFRDKLDDKALDAADKKFVDWLPEHNPGIMDTPARFNAWLSKAGDRVTRSFYPGGLHINKLWDTKGGQVITPLREPQRYYDTHSPGTWEKVHGGYLNYERATKVWSEEMLEGGLKSGLIVKRGKFDPKKHWSPYQLNKAKNEMLFDMLNTKPNTEAWNKMAKTAGEDLTAYHWRIRERLDLAADQQGIKIGVEGDEAPYLTGYIKHFFDRSQLRGGARPPEYLGMSKEAEVFAGHLLHRKGTAGYPRDAWGALELYGRAMNRRQHIQPVYDEITVAGQEIAEKTGNAFNKQYAADLIHQLQGRPAFVGAKVDAWLGGAINKDGGNFWKPNAIDRALVGLSGLWWAGMLPGNSRYPLMQMVTGVSTTAGRFGLFRTIRGLTTQASREGQAASRAAGTYEQFEKVFESSFMRGLSKFLTEKGVSFGPLGLQTTASTEEFIRGVTFHAAIDMHMTKLGISSWDELAETGMKSRVVYEALRSSLEVNHMFGALGRSPVVAQTVGKGPAVTATQFLSFIPKQSEELLAQVNRNPGNLAMYMAMSGWLSRVSAEQLGMDITDYVGLGYLPSTPSDLTSPGMDTIIAGMDWLSAVDKGDLEMSARAVEDFLGSLDSMIPMMVAWKTGSKKAEELVTGRSMNTRGEFDRPMEIGGFSLQNQPNGFSDAVEMFGRGMGPHKTGDLGFGAAPGVGGDLYPILTGTRGIREKMFQNTKKAVLQDARDYAFEAQSKVVQLWNLLEDDKLDEAAEIEQLLVNRYNIVFEPGNSLEKKALAQEVSWALRALEDADDQLIVKVVDEIRSNGLSLGN